LATETVCVSVLPVSLSESVAEAETIELAGPSGKVHWNEPPAFVLLSVPLVPLAPQLVVTALTVSWPGSLIV
jgi:hypothetical protein